MQSSTVSLQYVRFGPDFWLEITFSPNFLRSLTSRRFLVCSRTLPVMVQELVRAVRGWVKESSGFLMPIFASAILTCSVPFLPIPTSPHTQVTQAHC